jgi:hypothetical protein
VSRLRTIDAALVAVLVVVSGAVVMAFIANSPAPDRFPDTPNYVLIANSLPRSFISSDRLPGYGVVMAIAAALPGGRNLELLVMQSLMSLAAVALTYYIGLVALGKRWLAFIPGLLIGTDLLSAGFARVAMSESTAVFLTTALAATAVSYLRKPRARRLWLMTALMIVLFLTRPEWAGLMLLLVPYALIVLARRGLLNRRLVIHGAASVGAVLLSIGAYSVANLAVNSYFGISSIVNVALMGKVMVYRMESEAPPPYDVLAPEVTATGPAQGPWPLTQIPPFNDRNHKTEGDFARAVIVRHPLQFSQHVVGTLLDSSTEYDAAFIQIKNSGPYAGPLGSLLDLSERRYASFVLVLPMALTWTVLGLFGRREDHRAQLLGALGVMALYGWITIAATTFDEFGRIHMPVNPIATVLVAGTLLLNLTYLVRWRGALAPLAMGALVAEAAAILWLPGRSASLLLFGLLIVALLQLLVSGAGFATGFPQGDFGVADRERVGGRIYEREGERRPEKGHPAPQQAAERSE